ncbi:MAG: hypothetical protein Fur0022_23840 [Anaerolineales bacterium]
MLYLLGLLIISPPILWGLNRLKVRYVFAWFWAIFVCTVVWGGLLALRVGREGAPRVIPLWTWGENAELFLRLDAVSWPFALALAGLGLAVVLTSAQRLADAQNASQDLPETSSVAYEDWRNQAAILGLMAWGLLGVTAGNPLTLLLAWAGADMLGLWILLVRITGREESERIVLDFSARVAGILLLIWAMVVTRGEGTPLEFGQIPGAAIVYLLFACGFRLGILPLQVYFFEDLPLRRGVGLMTRMAIPAASSLVLLVHIGATEIPAGWVGILLMFTALAGVYAGGSWLVAQNELDGRAFWMLGVGALALGAAIRGEASAVQAWGLALLLVGGGLFLLSARSRWMKGLVLLGGVMFTALPGMPTASGVALYAVRPGLAWGFLLVHALLLAGFVRHLQREGELGQVAVPAIRGAYALGLLILPGTLMLAGGIGGGIALPAGWWAALIGVALAGGIQLWMQKRSGNDVSQMPGDAGLWGLVRRAFAFHWLYRFFWRGYRLLGGGVAFVSVLLEGEAGILWTLLLLFLLISLIATQGGIGG